MRILLPVLVTSLLATIVVADADIAGSPAPARLKEPLEYFQDMMPVFSHARCVNCHGGVVAATGQNHEGGRVEADESCTSSCHTQANNDNVETKDNWTQPPQEKWFVGLNGREMCALMANVVMRRGSEEFINHLQGDFQIDLGFEGRIGGARERAAPEPPQMEKRDFMRAAALWIDEGQASCVREGTITYEERLASNEFEPLGPIETTYRQSGRRRVTLEFANGRYSGRITVSGQIDVLKTIKGVVNGQPCQSVIHSVTDYSDARPDGTTEGIQTDARVTTTIQRNGDYMITVDLPPERHRKRDHGSYHDGCGVRLPSPPAETLEQEWPATRFTVRGKLHDPEDRASLVGGEVREVTARESPSRDPWLPDHYSAMSQAGGWFPVTVTASWNIKVRP
jgi:hypothetical protein